MIGITIGIGDKYRSYAQEAAKRFTAFTGLSTIILTEEHIHKYGDHPIIQHGENMVEKSFYLKFFMLEIAQQDICYFDADYCVIDYWQPHKVFDGTFTAVKDRTRYLYDNNILYCDIARYVNAGFYMASYRNHSEFFKKCRELGTECKKVFHDQCILNTLLQLDKVPVRYLDRRYNCTNFEGVMTDVDVKAIHCCSNYNHYKEGTSRRSSGKYKIDTIAMAGLAGPATLVFEDKKQRNYHLYADGTTSNGDVWFCTTENQMFICDNYINDPKIVLEIYEQL